MKVVIIGAGTGAMGVADILIRDKNFQLYGFIGTAEEDTKLSRKKLYNNIPFLGDHSLIPRLKENGIVGFVVAIGNNAIKEKAFYEATQAGLTPVNVISPNSQVENSSIIGKGVIINAGCIISHGVEIGDNTFLGVGVIVGINTTVRENCVISTASVIGGECEIGRNVFIDVHSTVISYLKVGKNQHVRAGTVVEESLPDLVRGTFE